MADHSSNQRADSAVFSEDDPFAELTRIMGHDPRRAEASSNEAEQEGDDLALELENELLGDLAEFSDEVHEEAVPQNDWQPQPSSDWRFDADEATQAPGEPAVDIAADMADELDESFAASFESEMRLEPADDLSAVSASEEEVVRSSEPPEVFDPQSLETEAIEPQFSGVDLDMTDPSAPVAETGFIREEQTEGAAEADDLDFSDQDFAQLDNDLEASLANEDWFRPEKEVADQNFGTSGAEASFAHQSDHAEIDEKPGTPEPEDFFEPQRAAVDHPVEFDDVEDTGQSEVPASFDPAADIAASADPFLSPQAFASSIAQGTERTSAVAGAVAHEEHDFTASLEEQLSAGFADETLPVEPAIEPEADESLQDESAWDVFEAVEPKSELSVEDDPVDATLSAPFWQQPEHSPGTRSPATEPSVPHIDTVDVPGNERVQVEDAAHIPEFVSEPERVPEAGSDDLELALARAFGDSESLPAATHSDASDEPFATVPADAYAAAALQPTEQTRDEDDFGFETAFADSFYEPDNAAGQDKEVAGDNQQPDAADAFALSDVDSWGDPSEDFERDQASFAPEAAAVSARPGLLSSRRNLAMFGVAGGVVILALVGVFAFGGGGEDNSAPVVVRADNEPIKVKPETPGGEQVPNQDNQVYQRVSGADAGTDPVQERLVSTAEEPVDVPQAAPKSEERLTPGAGDTVTATSEPVTAMTPRRVRTMVVRPDGTIVPREPEAPVQNAEAAVATGNDSVPASQVGATIAQPQTSQETPPDARLASADPLNGSSEDANATAGSVPVTAPVPPSRPAATAAQPPRTVETSQPAQVAAAPSQPAQPVAQTPAPAPVTSGSDGWSVQISSQPTVEAAQKSYQDMAQRYGGLLTGKGVNIVKAEIAGKGTYYRVRIPSSSKDEAIRLCSQLKSAGGSCFVSK
ncbi:SPOR domain-containing protein [Nitratireductor kimnyeongensis]|uniref:SPOR domain-containing protein n=1 Tax=Nitratireductor kimnyeongensis TaxID=430679 RepID=A0ABW0T9H3_9HYPH|nr:SPOR domain-containing protein [Nitratireductor kimnyeongensis]QZZ35780.1 SPOR domain-containing protein [Nitratireductor kimnyeongensis]